VSRLAVGKKVMVINIGKCEGCRACPISTTLNKVGMLIADERDHQPYLVSFRDETCGGDARYELWYYEEQLKAFKG
jgi:hypothetical protein